MRNPDFKRRSADSMIEKLTPEPSITLLRGMPDTIRRSNFRQLICKVLESGHPPSREDREAISLRQKSGSMLLAT